MTKFCKGCGKDIPRGIDVRCPKCKKKNTAKRKYKRRHIHRLKVAKRKVSKINVEQVSYLNDGDF